MTATNPTASKPAPSAHMQISEEERERRVNRVNSIVAWLTLILGLASAIHSVIRSDINFLILGAGLIISFLIQMMVRKKMLAQNPSTRALIVAVILSLDLTLFAIFLEGIALPVAGIILAFSILTSTTLMEGRRAETMITVGQVLAMLAGILGTYSPTVQRDSSIFGYFFIAISIALIATFTLLFLAGQIAAPLRIKVVLAALTIVIVPLAVQNVIDSRFLRNSLQNQTNQSLINSASLLANRVDEFFRTNRASIASEALLPVFSNYLSVPENQRKGSLEEQQMITAMEFFKAGLKVKEKAYLTSFALINQSGRVIFSSVGNEIGQIEDNSEHFIATMDSGRVYHSPVLFTLSDGSPYIYFSQIVKNADQEIVGVIRIKYDAYIIQSFSEEYASPEGTDAYPVIFDENFLRVAETKNKDILFTTVQPIDVQKQTALASKKRLPLKTADLLSTSQPELANQLAISDSQPFFTADVSLDDTFETVAVVKMSSLPWYVLYAQDVQYLQSQVNNQNRVSMLIAFLIAGLISMAATFITRAFTRPVIILTDTAQQVTGGNLEARAVVKTNDELSLLAEAFNLMTSQVKQLVSNLEETVKQRTRELALRNDSLVFRARQFETIAEVARSLTQSQELETLLNAITTLISERFGFYHVGVFLLDDQGEYAVLRAANSEGGKRMLSRQHRLKVGQVGIVGYVTAAGKGRIVTDVGEDAVYFNNPDLPLTRSEMALPLKVGERVIGALDVQSVESNAFSEDDIQLFNILADQVAIAIYNNQLYVDSIQALAEAKSVHQRYLQQQWSQESAGNQHAAFRYTPTGTSAQPNASLPEIQTALHTGQVVQITAAQSGGSRPAIVVPVTLRGEPIGVIRIQEESGEREWDAEEIETIQAVAEQVALALENARLFNQTVRKAERERKVLEITSRIRATNDPQEMLQIAVEELQRTLRASRAQVVLQTAEQPSSGKNHNGNGHLPDPSSGQA